MKRAALLFAALSALGASPEVNAHAFLERALPAVGSTVHRAPAQVKLWFSEELQPAASTVKVLDKNGEQVDRMDAQVDRGDAALLKVTLKRLVPGIYRIVWRVQSVDANVTEGDFTFEVAP